MQISNFSKHLFWDVDPAKLDFEKDKKFIIQRVLQYGFYNDWLLIKETYGLEKISEISVKIRDLDDKTANFVSLICKIPKDQFLCYTIQQSIPKHWNF